MASYVYYKFRSQKEPQRVTIDGPYTDVWNLKREIITLSRLGDGTDFDLKIYKENTREEYTDDTEVIPKDSTVDAVRLPASAPGKGRAARYVSGKPPISAKPSAATGSSRPAPAIEMSSDMTEEQRLAAFSDFTNADWQRKQQEMSTETRVPMQGPRPNKKANVPEGEPPHGYICYRCGKKGHWIQACPTNDDASYDNKNRIKRTTGIPRSMLKRIDQADIDKLDEQERQHVMVNAEGEYVFAQADEKKWKKHLEQVRASEAEKQKASETDKVLQERGLECPVDKRLFVDPMKTPCCGKTYCHDCIENALLENDLVCPGCETENVSLEALKPDEEMKESIKAYQEEKSNEKQRSTSPAGSIKTPRPEDAEAGSRPATSDGSKSPKSETGQGKKRSADEADESTNGNTLEVPAMKRQKSGEGTPAADTAGADDSKPSTPVDDSSNAADQPDFPANMMPPDFSQMQNMGMNFPMGGMPNMMGMPFMNMPNMMMGMPNMNMMNMMTGMNGMGMNGIGGNMGNMGNMNMNNHHQQNFPNQRGGYNNNKHAFRNKRGGFHNNSHNNHNAGPQQQAPKQPEGLSGVPTGPKAMQSTQPASGGTSNNNSGGGAGFYPPTGPAANSGKFANQQRYAGNEEDNAYMRQPVNPQRQWQRNNRRGGKMRDADYREL